MPYINSPKKVKRDNTRNEHTPMRELRRKAYNSTQWRKLRDVYIKQNPLCQECLNKGKVTPAEDIHHINSPFRGGEINWHLFLDYDNLEGLCKQCHSEHHNKEQGHISPKEILKQLEDLLDETITDEEIEVMYADNRDLG